MYGLMATTPFVLARVAPRAASFETRWFPLAWSHWLWFVGLLFLVFVCRIAAALLVGPLACRRYPTFELHTTTGVIVTGIAMIVVGPIAEEIFWRGYVLEQFRKLTRSAVALLVQSALFGMGHLHFHLATFAFVQAFLIGAVFGIWRIKFRSLLPLIVAHMIMNSVIAIPILREQYQDADVVESLEEDLVKDYREHLKNVRSNPKSRQIQALSREPAQEAVPAIIEYFADPDEDVRLFAQEVLIQCFRPEAEPYLKAPLSSRDKKKLDGALFVVGMCRYTAYTQQVRDIAWSADEGTLPYLAVSTLWDLKDEEGLREIARSHPNAKVRESAERILGYLSRPAPADGSSSSKRPEPPASLAPRSRSPRP